MRKITTRKRRSRTILRKKLDKAWSQVILSRKKCEVCGKTEYLNAHHIEGRRNLMLRWEPRNGVCLCAGCHTFKLESAHQSPEWFHYWLEENRWEDLNFVICKRTEIKKWSLDQLEEELNKLNKLI